MAFYSKTKTIFRAVGTSSSSASSLLIHGLAKIVTRRIVIANQSLAIWVRSKIRTQNSASLGLKNITLRYGHTLDLQIFYKRILIII